MAKPEWLIILPDYEGALEKRMEVRPYVVFNSGSNIVELFAHA